MHFLHRIPRATISTLARTHHVSIGRLHVQQAPDRTSMVFSHAVIDRPHLFERLSILMLGQTKSSHWMMLLPVGAPFPRRNRVNEASKNGLNRWRPPVDQCVSAKSSWSSLLPEKENGVGDRREKKRETEGENRSAYERL